MRASYFNAVASAALTAALAASVAPGRATAAGQSTDIELVRPTFSESGVPGVDGPIQGKTGTLTFGLLGQYARDPLVIYADEADLGAVVRHRDTAHLGVSYAFADAAAFRVVVPAAYQWGSEVPERSADGAAVGDLSVGLRALRLGVGPLHTSIRGDLLVPTGTETAWMAEDDARFVGGLLASVDAGPAAVLVDASFTARSAVDTRQDFVLGPEVALHLGGRFDAVPDRFGLWLAWLGRGGTSGLLAGGAENSAEALGGVRIGAGGKGRTRVDIDLGGGKGIADGYGTSTFRVLGGLTVTRLRREEGPRGIAIAIDRREDRKRSPDDIDDALDIRGGQIEIEWEEGELARVERKRIVIRDDIRFEVGTSMILEESVPTLLYIAKLMAENAQIAHLLIEGHASEEGDYAFNYRLSMDRACRIYEELLQAGVHPDRMSFRAMGEVAPGRTAGGAGGAGGPNLASQRRVELKIVRELDPLEPEPKYNPDVRLPWSGEPVAIRAPTMKAPPPQEAPKDDKLDVKAFGEDDEDDKEEKPAPPEKEATPDEELPDKDDGP